MPHLSLSLLGPFQACLDEEPITDFESAKVRALLAYLAVEADRPHPRNALAGLFWPERSNRDALSNLRYALYNLRNAIRDREAKPPFLLITRRTLRFNRESDHSLDVAAFEERAGESAIPSLQSAVRLYRGPFLDGFSLGDCPAFEEWALFKREHLNRKMISVLRRLASCHEQAGEYDQARKYLRRQIELEPWDESAHRELMRLLALAGRRSAALAQYEACRSRLNEELGVEPTPATTALYERIKSGDIERQTQVTSARVKAPPATLSPPFVARERELAHLNRLLDAALTGQGQVAFVTGEAGSGKTALVNAFARQAMDAHSDLIVVSGDCSAHPGIGDPYLPFREILQMLTSDVEARRAGGTLSREHADRLWAVLPAAAQTLVEHGPDLIERFVPGEALVLRVEGSGVAGAFTPRRADWYTRLKELTKRDTATLRTSTSVPQEILFDQVIQVLKNMSDRYPLLIVLDNLQWADTGTINLLSRLGQRLTEGHLLLVGTYRPEEVPPQHPLASVVNELQRRLGEIRVDLDQAEGRRFVEALLDSEPNRLGEAFRETLYRHTDGNPLFTIELLRGLQERDELVRDETGRWVEDASLDWERMPSRVGAVIAERLGRLSPESRKILTAASVEGETFTAEVVDRVVDLSDGDIARHLSGPLSDQHRLVRAQSVQRIGKLRLSRYRFRHCLFREYLYQSLDGMKRTRLHRGVGEALVDLHESDPAQVAAQIAHHFEAAGMADQAVDYLLRAGNRAVALSANGEAIALFTRGLKLLETLPASPERAERELELQIALGAPLLGMQGWGASEHAGACDRAYELCRQIGSTAQFLQAMFSLADLSRARGELERSRDLGKQMLDIAQRTQDPKHIALAHATLGETGFFRGELNPAHAHLEQALVAHDPQRHRALTALTGPSLDVMCLTWDAWALWVLGYPEQALTKKKQAVTVAREMDHPFSLGFALALGDVSIRVLRREFEIAQKRIEDLMQLSLSCDLPSIQAWFTILQGWKEAMEGRGKEGMARMREGLALWADMGAVTGRAFQLLMLTEAHRRDNQVEEGLRVLEEGLTLVDRTGEKCLEAKLHRLKGELLLTRGGSEAQAAECFQKAVDIARSQQAKSWELRAAISLSRLWRRQGRRDEARELLSEVYEWFSEGFHSPDLQEARSLLESDT